LDNADSDARKVNTILFGLKEKAEKTALAQVPKFLNKEYFSNMCKPVSAYRLGEKKEGRIRPIKLKLISEAEKWELL